MSLQHIRNISIKNVRGFAAAAATKPKPDATLGTSHLLPREEVKLTNQDNVVVCSVETNKPLAKLAVYYRAGSRYEEVENQGIVHALRAASGLTTAKTTRFGLARNIEQVGGNLFCTTGREHVAYTLETTRDNIDDLQDIMRDVTSKQVFKRWELTDSYFKPRITTEVLSLAPEVRVLEKLHKVCYRRGLGNSLYMPKSRIGKHSSEMLGEYVTNNFVEASVVGVGVPHEICERLARRIKVPATNNRQTEPSKFYAGEIRKDVGGDLAYVALGIEGASFSNGKEMVAAALASRALGSGPRTKRGNYAGAKLTPAQGEGHFAASFSSNYSDSGILGVMVVGLPSVISGATKKVADIFRGANFSDEDVTRAKNILKADLGYTLESETELADDMGLQGLFNGKVYSFQEIVPLIDSVSTADVNNLLKKGAANLALSAYGNIGKVPYIDELK